MTYWVFFAILVSPFPLLLSCDQQTVFSASWSVCRSVGWSTKISPSFSDHSFCPMRLKFDKEVKCVCECMDICCDVPPCFMLFILGLSMNILYLNIYLNWERKQIFEYENKYLILKSWVSSSFYLPTFVLFFNRKHVLSYVTYSNDIQHIIDIK